MPDSNLMPHPEMLGLISKRTQNTFNSSNINQNPLSAHSKNTKIYSAQQKKSNQNHKIKRSSSFYKNITSYQKFLILHGRASQQLKTSIAHYSRNAGYQRDRYARAS